MHVVCWFFGEILPLIHSKALTKTFWPNLTFFHDAGNFDLRKKIGEICLVSWKNKDKLYFGYNFVSGFASNIEDYCLNIPEKLKVIPCTEPETLMFKWWKVS